MNNIAVFGGTFDPIHNGHLQTSCSIQQHFNFDSYIFLPCKIPALKPAAVASNEQRVEMIRRAIKETRHNFKLDLRELERPPPSYMIETLTSFRAEYPQASITLIIGYDAFLSLPQWHQWQKLITQAHLLVMNRSDFASQPMPDIMHEFLRTYQTINKTDLLTTQAGKVFLFNAGTFEISSTLLRKGLKKGAEIKSMLPDAVYEYIKLLGLYQ